MHELDKVEAEAELEHEELLSCILQALMKLNGDLSIAFAIDESIEEMLNAYMDGEVNILFSNKRVVAFTSWNYDGTWFAVVDLLKKELVMSSTDSDNLVVDFFTDSLIRY